jgi:hypothetical protein
MKYPRLSVLFVLLVLVCPLTAQMREVLREDFEAYPLDETIAGRMSGGRAWRVVGAMPGDLAVVTAADAAEGGQSLLLSDMSAGRVRVILEMEPISTGSLSVSIKEQVNDDGRPDAFLVMVGAAAISRKPDGDGFWFTAGKGRGRTVRFVGPAHRYAPGKWNRLRLEFDSSAKTAAFFINDVEVARLENPSADFSARAVQISTYSSITVGDTIFLDDIVVCSADASETRPAPAAVENGM